MCDYVLDEFERGYAHAVLDSNGFWPEDDAEEFERWEAASFSDFGPAALAQIRSDCAKFRSLLPLDQDGIGVLDQALEYGYDEYDAGWDFWQSRQGSGVSYVDRGLDGLGEILDASAEALGETHVELGGDGFIYFL